MIKLAYQIDDRGYSGSSHVVFAETEAEIEQRIEDDCYETEGDGDWTITRSPQYDQYSEAGKVPNSVLHGNGWYFYCAECERRTDEEKDEDDYDEGEMIPPPIDVQFLGDFVFCCGECRDRWQEQARTNAKIKANALEAFTKNFPGAEIKHSWLCDSDLSVEFTFPGATRRVHWKSSDPEFVSLVKVDQAAWQQWRAQVQP